MGDPALWRNPRDGIWHIHHWRHGKRRTWSTKTRDRARAQAILRAFKERLYGGQRSLTTQRSTVYLLDFATEALAYSRANKAAKTVEGERLALQHLLRIAGNVRLSEIDFGLLEKFKQERLREKVSAKTLNNNLGAISSLLTLAKKLGYLAELPRIEKLRLDRKEPRFLSLEEIGILLRSCEHPKLQTFVRIALLTGMRPGEICKLRWSDVDFAGGMIHVRQTKGKRDRVVPLHEDLRTYLAGWTNLRKGVMPNGPKDSRNPAEGRRAHMITADARVVGLVYNRLRRLFKALMLELGWPDVTGHTLRHTFTAHGLMNGVMLDTMRRWLGHADLRTLSIYAHMSDAHSREAMRALPALPTVNEASTLPISELRRLKGGVQEPVVNAEDGESGAEGDRTLDLLVANKPDVHSLRGKAR